MKPKKGVWYFAHQYSGNKSVNFGICNVRAGSLILRGWLIWSPISMSHPISEIYPKIGEKWYDYDDTIIETLPFAGIILPPEWKKSKGCRAEKRLFEKLGREILYYKDLVR